MGEGKRKIRVCLLVLVLAAVVIGVVYYWYNGSEIIPKSEGTLVEREEAEYVI